MLPYLLAMKLFVPSSIAGWKSIWDTSKESNLTMQSILFSLLVTYTKAFDHECKGIIIKTKNETSYLATTGLKKHITREFGSPSDYSIG